LQARPLYEVDAGGRGERGPSGGGEWGSVALGHFYFSGRDYGLVILGEQRVASGCSVGCWRRFRVNGAYGNIYSEAAGLTMSAVVSG